MSTDTPPSLTDQALARLRKLAEGNGLPPEKIEFFGTEEQVYTLPGTLTLIPKCDVETGRYPGPARGGKGRQVLGSMDVMHGEVARRKQQFLSGRSWIEAAEKELKAAPGEGWGLEGAHITLPEQSITLTASTGCPACHGQKMVTCSQCHGQGTFTCSYCHGQRQTTCYACGGTGRNSQDPTLACAVCGGRRFATCRQCGGSGQTTCPTCHGRRGTPCPTCNGSGLVSEDVAIACGVDLHFKLNAQGLPSGLRNGLGRLGMANLAKGHADITRLPPAKTESTNDTTGDDDKEDAPDENAAKITSYDILYEAKMPYADMRMNLNGTKVIVGVFGKRAALLNVPPFLDRVLESARQRLKIAAQTGALGEVLKTRAFAEALQLELSGKGTPQEFRRLYPVGLSQPAMQEILSNLRKALKKQTLTTRSIIAAVGSLIGGGFFAGVFLTELHASLTQSWAIAAQASFDLALLLVPIGLGWFALNLATKSALQRRFKDHTIALQQTTGKTGYAMFVAIVVFFAVIVFLAPIKPTWLLALHL